MTAEALGAVAESRTTRLSVYVYRPGLDYYVLLGR